MDAFTIFFFAIFAAIAGRFIYGRVKYGSWAGSFLKGSIAQTMGEVSLSSGALSSQKLQVHAMHSDGKGEDFVALVVTAKAPMAASMQPYKLTKNQALELADYLTKASRHVA